MARNPPYLYLIAIGSNQRMPHIGSPRQIVEQAIAALETIDIDVFLHSSAFECRPVGPSMRSYANAAALIETALAPDALLYELQAIERHFGRQRVGQRWRARTLDLDILLWSGGIWSGERPALAIPHVSMRQRNFVLGPAAEIAADWRDPLTNLTIRQLFHRLNRPKPLDHRRAAH